MRAFTKEERRSSLKKEPKNSCLLGAPHCSGHVGRNRKVLVSFFEKKNCFFARWVDFKAGWYQSRPIARYAMLPIML